MSGLAIVCTVLAFTLINCDVFAPVLRPSIVTNIVPPIDVGFALNVILSPEETVASTIFDKPE